MRAFIDEFGILTVKAEKPIEAYAIRKWSEECLDIKEDKTILDGSKFLIDGSLREED